ncbi:16S rRNA (guanine(966)-N(2))-methyltransferase RsmD [Metamycoplasma buccale]|uniref:16S rRNA (guanine(966)-N(2))-methyltransferase RsmD n=1 Tax=Metamycoplasma buccale TaxID=55602 RepID=UPI00398E3A1E
MLRIIAGKYRHCLIKQPSKVTTRPTTDRAREALFSSIQFQIEGKEFLDLFSGSGSFCLEALSRGAKHAISVEKSKDVVKIIKENKDLLKETNLEIINTDAISFLKKNNIKKFDYIYLDPPYALKDVLLECLDLITTYDLIKKDGYLLIETNQSDFSYANNGYEIVKVKKYGKIYIYYLQNNSI